MGREIISLQVGTRFWQLIHLSLLMVNDAQAGQAGNQSEFKTRYAAVKNGR